MDADLSHNPKYIKDFIKYIKNCDVVIGSRYISEGKIPDNWGIHRRLISSTGNILTRAILKIPITDCTSGFKIINLISLYLEKINMIKHQWITLLL